MSLLKRLTHILIMLPLMATYSFAQQEEDGITNITVNANFFAYTTGLDLSKKINISFDSTELQKAGLIPRGSEAEFLKAVPSPAGQYALQVRVTKVAGNLNGKVVKKNEVIWIPYDPENSDITFRDKNGYEIQDPEAAMMPQEQKSKDPNLARNRDKTKTEADFCATGTCKSKSPDEKNRDALGEFIQTLMEEEKNQRDPEDQWANDPMITKFSYSKEVQDSIDRGMKFKKSRSTGKCWQFTKLAMRKKRTRAEADFTPGDLIDSYPISTHPSKTGIRVLKEQGWVNLMEDPKYKALIKGPENAPKGAVLIYSNTRDPKHPGHAEIKTDFGEKGGYVSDFYRSVDEPLQSRKLIGVMIKEDL